MYFTTGFFPLVFRRPFGAAKVNRWDIWSWEYLTELRWFGSLTMALERFLYGEVTLLFVFLGAAI